MPSNVHKAISFLLVLVFVLSNMFLDILSRGYFFSNFSYLLCDHSSIVTIFVRVLDIDLHR